MQATLSVALLPAFAHSLSLEGPWGDHMVLQQGRVLSFQGLASPGAELELACGPARAGGRADARGRFVLELPPMKAGGPHEFVLRAGPESIEFNDVLVGELWIASGQSNMEWSLAQSEAAEPSLARARRPGIRFINIERKVAPSAGPWKTCDPQSAADLSALAYHFAVELHERLGVPVGILNAPWSGTPAETWTPLEALEAEPKLAGVLRRWEARPEAERVMYSKGWRFRLELRKVRLIPRNPDALPLEVWPGRAASAAGAALIPQWSASSAEGASTAFDPGWGRSSGLFHGSVPPGCWAAASATLAPEGAFDLSGYEAVEFEARGDSSFDFALSQVDILDGDAFAGGEFKAGKAWKRQRADFSQLAQQGWGAARVLDLGKASRLQFRLHAPNQFPDQPGLLFDSMIRPLAALRARGALWYQGESNLERADEYGALMKALVGGWRAALGDPDLAFLSVQLPDAGPHRVPGREAWAETRQAQAAILELPNTGLAQGLGLGDPMDMHPKRKRELGKRLAWEALGRIHGRPGLGGRGPRLLRARAEGSQWKLEFEALGGLRAPSGPRLDGFSWKGENGEFLPAPARLEGGMVAVELPPGARPRKLRYAWADRPHLELTDSLGVPACGFETALQP